MIEESTTPRGRLTAAVRASAKRSVPSIRSRLSNALILWALMSSAAVAVAVWLAAGQEVDELLDDTLRVSAELLGGLAGAQPVTAESLGQVAAGPGNGESRRFAWQVVSADGRVTMRSSLAPAEAWRATPSAGFSNAPEWRLYGLSLGADGRMLYAAQSRGERFEARREVVLNSIAAALAIGAFGLVWLRSRIGVETATLSNLTDRLAGRDASDLRVALGAAERRELQPVHDAIDQLTGSLERRIDAERAFAGHAAHALRTPLAGIDVQLAVALRECPPELRPRLERAREAGTRLQRVVTALLGLFRSGEEPRRGPVELAELVTHLPLEGLAVKVAPGARVSADVDLLTAALLDLLDNSRRYGASSVLIDVPSEQTLRLRDDGPGVDTARRRSLQAAVAAQAYEGETGLGLMLADRVARAHGGALMLPDTDKGFEVDLWLGPPEVKTDR